MFNKLNEGMTKPKKKLPSAIICKELEKINLIITLISSVFMLAYDANFDWLQNRFIPPISYLI
jgi:hypothetical protein